MSRLDPVAITGIGVLTPLGDTVAAVGAALRAGRSAIGPAADLGAVAEARIAEFEAARYATVRGLRLYNRPTRLGICAAKLALVDSGCDAAVAGEDLGVVGAFSGAHLETLFEYDRSLVVNGPLRTNPALMPIGIPSAPGAAIALAFGAKAFSISLADGGTSSLDALGLGARLVASGRARACVVVGAYSPCMELTLSASRAGMLASAEAYRVFDRRHAGMAFGEGAAAVVLEPLALSLARGVQPKALLRAQATTFAPHRTQLAAALGRACAASLREPGAGELALVSAGANGTPDTDRCEAEALVASLGGSASRTPVMAVKASLGDPIDCAGLLQSVLAVEALRTGSALPIVRLEDPECAGLRYATSEMPLRGDTALVTSTALGGGCAAAVLSALA